MCLHIVKLGIQQTFSHKHESILRVNVTSFFNNETATPMPFLRDEALNMFGEEREKGRNLTQSYD